MLQPVTTSPFAVSRAAPTLNPENRARACSRASTAAATSAASSKCPVAAISSALGAAPFGVRAAVAVRMALVDEAPIGAAPSIGGSPAVLLLPAVGDPALVV